MQEPTLKLVGWSGDELYVQIMIDGVCTWVPVDTPEDQPDGTVWIRSKRYRIGGTRLIPCPA